MISVKNFNFLLSLFFFERGFDMMFDGVLARKEMLFYQCKK